MIGGGVLDAEDSQSEAKLSNQSLNSFLVSEESHRPTCSVTTLAPRSLKGLDEPVEQWKKPSVHN